LLTLGLLAALAACLPAPARAGSEPPEGPSREKSTDEPRIEVFLNSPADLDALWKALARPDFVLIKGDRLRDLIDRARGGSPPSATAAVVRSVAVQGEVAGDLASLTIDFGVALEAPGPSWVPIRLDGHAVTEARDGDADRPLRVAAGGGWEVELRGRGDHRLRVGLRAVVRSTAEGRRLELAIPEAASTRVELDVPRRVAEAAAGPDEPVERRAIRGGEATRLSAHLAPRPRLDLSWRIEEEPGAQLSPLLSIQGDIAIDINPGSFRTSSSWEVRSVRGTATSLQFRLDPEDEVLELELDGQPIPAGIERVDGTTRLTIALAEPLRPGPSKHLVMTTRRALPSRPSERLIFAGFSLIDAREQSGAIGIAQSQAGDPWIVGAAGRGLRQIDPRTELPPELRARPGTVLAYQFFDQPFELSLRADPAPPQVHTESRTTVRLDATRAAVETSLSCVAAHGRLFELGIVLPRGLELDSAGPRDVVELVSPEGAADADGVRLLTLRLTPRAQEGGAFTVLLKGRQAIDPSRPVVVTLFQPRATTAEGGRIAVLTDRNLTADLTDGAEAFRPALQEPPADWPWPADHRAGQVPALWLRHDGHPPALPLRVTVHPRAISHETSLKVEVGRSGVEVEQQTQCAVHFGALDALDVEAPAGLRWDLDGDEVVAREDLGTTPAGDRRTRLRLGDAARDKALLKFRLRPASSAPLESDRPTELEVPWVRVREGTAAPVRATVASDDGIHIEPRAPGWTAAPADDDAAPGDSVPITRFVLVGPEEGSDPLRLVATARPLAALPALVASRLLIRTVLGPEDDLRTTAWYRVESHDATLPVALPAGAEWVRARIGGEAVGQVEPIPKAGGYRLRFPKRAARGPVLVELEYHVPARLATAWDAPRLLDGGVVQETLWEVRLPWSRAVVGTPSGWIDENQWHWDRYTWMRRSREGAGALSAWVNGNTAQARDGADDAGDAYHAYLFGRPGPPAGLRPVIASRAWLVALCSGPMLALGVLILHRRRPPQLIWAAALALTLAAAMVVQPATTILAVQSSLVGVVFTIVAALVQRLVERPRRAAAAVFRDPGGLASTAASSSSLGRMAAVGSDDSTAIRVRSVSTVDHVPAAAPPTPEEAVGRGTGAERG
jgi:hypothetical protein